MGTGAILAEIFAILTAHIQTVRKDGADLSSEKHLGRGIHFFLTQLAFELDTVPSMKRVILVGVYPDGMVHLMHSLLSVRVDIYYTSRGQFACLDKLPSKGLPLVLEIPHEYFAARRVLCRNWTTSPTLGGSPILIGRKSYEIGRGRRRARAIATWLAGG